jgi:hypothetical protein
VETNVRSESGARNANDHVYNVMWGCAAEDGVFVCECGDSCAVEVLMTPSEYVGLRDRGELVCAPGHAGPTARRGEYAARRETVIGGR